MSGYTIEEVLEFVEENDVKFIRLAFCDIFGNQKNISILPGELNRAFEEGIPFDSFLIYGYNDMNHTDLFLRPDPATLNILPWRPQQGRVIRFYCDIIDKDGNDFPYSNRYFLQNTIKELKELGISVRVGLKSEFYLFKTYEDGNPTDTPWDNGTYLDVAPLDRGENIRREICLCLEEMDIQPQSSHHEYGPGQNMIEFKASDPVTTADNFITFKNVVGNIASRNGVYASFAPRPLKGKPGNGLHMDISLYRKGARLNEVDPKLVEAFIAGVLNHIDEITLFLNNTKDSYIRFGENKGISTIGWSTKSRLSLIRVPDKIEKCNHFILRSPDSGINPFLAMAMILQAGIYGIRNNEKLMTPVEELTDEKRDNLPMLPSSLEAAIEAVENSEFLAESNGKDIANRYVGIIKTHLGNSK